MPSGLSAIAPTPTPHPTHTPFLCLRIQSNHFSLAPWLTQVQANEQECLRPVHCRFGPLGGRLACRRNPYLLVLCHNLMGGSVTSLKVRDELHSWIGAWWLRGQLLSTCLGWLDQAQGDCLHPCMLIKELVKSDMVKIWHCDTKLSLIQIKFICIAHHTQTSLIE